MEKKIEVGKEVFVDNGRKEIGKVMKRTTTVTKYIGGGIDIREIYLIRIGNEELEFDSGFVFSSEIDLANHILKRYGICDNLRFRPVCETCMRLKGKLIS